MPIVKRAVQLYKLSNEIQLLTRSPRQSNSFILATFVVTVYVCLCFQRKISFVRDDENLRTGEGTRCSVLQTETSFRTWLLLGTQQAAASLLFGKSKLEERARAVRRFIEARSYLLRGAWEEKIIDLQGLKSSLQWSMRWTLN